MIQGIRHQSYEPLLDLPQGQATRSRSASGFEGLFRSATGPVAQDGKPPAQTNGPAGPGQQPQRTPDRPVGLGDPNVQAWLNSYYAQEQKAGASSGATGDTTATTSYAPATGAALSALDEGMYGPDAIYEQALANQAGNSLAALTGENPVNFTAQLPGIPSLQAQQGFDHQLAYSNAQRLLAGEPIDTAAYWSDPGPLTIGGKTFTSQQLGYAGPGQSSGPEPIWISDANQVGANTFTVPGYSGTVTGIQPGRFYTLQQLEQAGLKTGQPEARFVPGSWSSTQTG